MKQHNTNPAQWPLRDILVLRSIRKLSARQALATISKFGDLDEAWHHPQGLGSHSSLELFSTSLRVLRRQADEILSECEDHGISIVAVHNQQYPKLLRETASPPLLVFVRGAIPPSDFLGVAIVGTRACTDYGRRATEWFVDELVQHNVAVVSGLANGIDAYAHARTVKKCGTTIAVIASGIAAISPWQSNELANSIVEAGGCIISEYRPGTKAMPVFFPQRNRIISGITKATLVVESKHKGGSLITAKFAMEQNRDVFAIPGSIYSSRSAGTNNLIRDHMATGVSAPSDLLNALGLESEEKKAQLNLTQEQARIAATLEQGPRHVDEIVAATGIATHVLQPALLELELRGIIQQDSAARYTLLLSI